MRDVGGEAAGAGLGLAQFPHRPLQLAGRLVERACQVRQFVAAAHGDPGVESAAAHAPGRLAQFPHRAQHAARGDQAGYQRDGEAGQGTVPAGHEEGVDVDLLVGHPHDGVQDESAGQHAVGAGLEDHGHGDGQVGNAVLDDPFEAAVGVGPCGPAQFGCDDGGDGVLARGGAHRSVLGEHHPGCGLPLRAMSRRTDCRSSPPCMGSPKAVCWTWSRNDVTAVSWAVSSSAVRASRKVSAAVVPALTAATSRKASSSRVRSPNALNRPGRRPAVTGARSGSRSPAVSGRSGGCRPRPRSCRGAVRRTRRPAGRRRGSCDPRRVPAVAAC